MLLSSWLLSLQNRLTRTCSRKALKGQRRRQRRPVQLGVERLEDRTLLASGPGLVSVLPNVGAFYVDGNTRNVAPRELTVQFSPGETMVLGPSAGDSGMRLERTGGDGRFNVANVDSDFGTSGAVVLQFDALRLGAGGNGVSIAVNSSPLGPSAPPRVNSVTGKAISVTLNTSNNTTAQQLVDLLNADPLARELVVASVKSGNAAQPVSGVSAQTFTLSGADSATVSSDFGVAPTKLEIKFVAKTSGPPGNGITLVVNKADLGALSAAPTVVVNGQTITVTLNNNAAKPTTALDLVNAIIALGAASPVNVSIPVGNPATVIGTAAPLNPDYSPLVLTGANDVVVPFGSVTIGDQPWDVILRFADTLPDDRYRLEFYGTNAGTTAAFLKGYVPPAAPGTALPFNGGTDARLIFTLNLAPQITSVVPQPVLRDKVVTIPAAVGSPRAVDGDRITISDGQQTRVFELNNTASPGVPVIRTTSDAQVDFDGTQPQGTIASTIAANLASAITALVVAGKLDVTATAAAGVVTIKGNAFQPTTSLLLANTGAATLSDGGLTQASNVVDVFFNSDALTTASAQNSAFYHLLVLNPATGATTSLLLPSTVTYSAATNNAKLDFTASGGLPAGSTFHLQVGNSTESDNTTGTATNVGSVFTTKSYANFAYIGDDTGLTTNAADVDLYRIVLTATGTIFGSVVPQATLDSRVRLLDSFGTQIGATANTVGAGATDNYSFAAQPAGTYYISVEGNGATTGSYNLTISSDVATPASDTNTSFASATANSNLGTLGTGGISISAAITNQTTYEAGGAIAFPRLPGGNDEPGHRDIPILIGTNVLQGEDYSGTSGTGTFTPTTLPVWSFSFPDVYGNDPQGNTLHNAITPNQKQRVREIFELYSAYAGIQFVESTSTGPFPSPNAPGASDNIDVITGDPRAINPINFPTVSIGSLRTASDKYALVSAATPGGLGNSEYGGTFFTLMMHEIGFALGLGESSDVTSIMSGSPLTMFNSPNNSTVVEPVFPADVDIVNTARRFGPTGSDIDLYRFQLTESGQFTAETVAQRSASFLDSVLTLYKATANASLTSDFNSVGAATIKLASVAPGALGNGVVLTVSRASLVAGAPPTINAIVAAKTIDVILNTNGGTTAQQLMDAINLDANARQLVLASITAGSAATNIAARPVNYSPLVTTGGATTVVSRNDDYYGKDSYVSLHLDPGTYYVGVTSTGNTNFDPTIPDSGFGGRTDGSYNLNLNFTADTLNTAVAPNGVGQGSSLVDAAPAWAPAAQPVAFDGDHDGSAGGVFDFWFKSGTTVFVDKSYAGPALSDGSLAAPYANINDAIANIGAAALLRIVGNGGNDGNPTTLADNLVYQIGRDKFLNPLQDGSTFDVPQGVTVMIDAGADLKFRGTNIDVGTSAQGVDRSKGALQVLGTPGNNVILTSFLDDNVGGDTDGPGSPATPGDWGGLVFRDDSDLESAGIFLNSVNQATITYGGGQVTVNSVLSVYDSVHLVTARPAIWFNTISLSADAPVSADPNSFDDALGRIGPDVHGNKLFNNSLNGLFVRIRTQLGKSLDTLDVNARFDDTDVVYILTENLLISGSPGNSLNAAGTATRFGGRLKIDPGVVVKLGTSRIEAQLGHSTLLAEGTSDSPIIFTSVKDDTYGRGGSFDTTNDGTTTGTAGQWGGFFFNGTSTGSIDHAVIAYAGGGTPVEGGFDNFNAVEIQQAHVRIANTTLHDNAAGLASTPRNNLLRNASATIFVRGAQPILVNNVFQNNLGSLISVNTNALNAVNVPDFGRSTGPVDAFTQFADNNGPLVRLNRMANNGTNGMEVRNEELLTEGTWDDTDIVHVLRNEITINNLHTYGGLRLQSNTTGSLVVKLLGVNAGFTANGIPLDIDDRIGGTLQIIGTPGHSVVLTSLNDDTVGASFDPNGQPQLDTNNNGIHTLPADPLAPQPGQWRSVRLDRYSNDRNVAVVTETEPAFSGGQDTDGTPPTAQFLGSLAPNVLPASTYAQNNNGDDYQPLGFEVHGFIAEDNAKDIDVYSFSTVAGSEVWFDIDRSSSALDTVLELIDANGTVLAMSQDSQLGTSSGLAQTLTKDAYLGGDFYGTNPRDAGLRVILPGTAGSTNTYYVRVRSNPAGGAPDLTTGGLSHGAYQLQIRTRQVDEKPGSTVHAADIRFATNGIEVLGLPAHSPLVGEAAETTGADFGSAQPLGNLLASDRNTISVAGNLTDRDQVDWYRFDLGYNLIESINNVNNGGPAGIFSNSRTWSTIFDIDYADGLARPDAIISVFDSSGTLVFVSRDSNVEDDQPATGLDVDDLTRGTVGKLDPFIGSVQLPVATPNAVPTDGSQITAATGQPRVFTYYVAISSNRQLPAALDATFQAGATNSLIRLEPIDSGIRVAEDHVGFQGYLSGQFGNFSPAGKNSSPTFSMFSTSLAGLSSNIVPWDLNDVTLYVTSTGSLNAYNPFTGSQMYNVGATSNIQDIAMRSDGRLFAEQSTGNNAGTAGNFLELDTGTAGTISSTPDGIPDFTATVPPPDPENLGELTTGTVDALAFERNGVASYSNLYYSVRGAHVANYIITGTPSSLYSTTNVNTGVNPGASVPGPVPASGSTPVATYRGYGLRGIIDTGVAGEITTGMAVLGGVLYGVGSSGGFYTIDKSTGAVSGRVNVGGLGLNWQGLALGPQNVNGGAYANFLFAVTSTGDVYALNAAGAIQSVFDTNGDGLVTGADLNHISTGAAATGIAFSPLDVNLWHPTMRRDTDQGHGINGTVDQARGSTLWLNSVYGRNSNQQTGGASFYFGMENYSTTPPLGGYFQAGGNNGQYGFLSGNNTHPDLTAAGTRTNNYDLPGGAYGSLQTNTFDLIRLSSLTPEITYNDKPTLYFNYFLGTQGAQTAQGDNSMRDSARVLLSTDGGVTWNVELATNNSELSSPTRVFTAELPKYITTSSAAYTDANQHVQELFDNTNGWRQARIDLGKWAGLSNLRLRFDFATAGAMRTAAAGNGFGNFNNVERAQNNVFEGFYVDDLIIGYAERGEMVTRGGGANPTTYFTVPQNPVTPQPQESLVGPYQLEIRRGTEYGSNVDRTVSTIFIDTRYFTQARLVPEISTVRRGDRNTERDQGHLQIDSNSIDDASQFGIRVAAGTRDSAANGSLPHPGSVRNLPTLNTAGLVPGVNIVNNVVFNLSAAGGGISFTGDNAAGPTAAVPYGRIVNNTVYGKDATGPLAGPQRGTGILVATNASPTLMNNVIARTVTAISVDNSSNNAGTTVTTELFQDNGAIGTQGTNAIPLNPGDPLFVSATPGFNRNFYLKQGSQAVDSSLNTLPDRANINAVESAIALLPSPLNAPNLDRFGQLRVDDPGQAPPPGLGSNIFKDRGAVERADFVGPTALLFVPKDNDPLVDLDNTPNKVFVANPPLFTSIVVQFSDTGIGVDDTLLDPTVLPFVYPFTLTRQSATGTVTLVRGVDYIYSYNSNTDQATFTSVTTFLLDSLYTITVDNSQATGVKDQAGNTLLPNNGSLTQFTIIATNAQNDPAVAAVPGAQTINEDASLTFNAANSNLITISDPDAFLAPTGGIIQVTLTAGNGKLTLASTTNLNFTFPADIFEPLGGSGIASATASATMRFRGQIADVNAALVGLFYKPNLDYNGVDNITVTTNDLGNFGPPPSTAQVKSASITINITAVNDAPTATISSATYSATEQTTLVLHGTGMSVADVDGGALNETVTLSVGEGTITVTAGTTGATVSGSGTGSVTIVGTIAQLNNVLAGNLGATVTYFDPSDTPSASTILTLSINDGGATGTGGPLSASATATINITAVNDAPTATISSATYSATEQTTLVLHGTGMSVADVDGGGATETATLSVGEGTLTVTAGTTGAAIGGSGTGSVTITGTLTQINNVLAGNLGATVQYIDNTDTPSASTILTLSINDGGATGTGGALSGSATATINITAVNDAPTATISSGTYSATEQTTLVLHGTGMSVADVDGTAAIETATLSVGEGTITATAGTTGATIGGFGTGTVTIAGTLAQINNVLAGNLGATVTYFDPSDTPAASTPLTLSINDGGATGIGGPLSGSATATINITAVDDPPAITIATASFSTLEDITVKITGIDVTDVDAGSSNVALTLSTVHGTLTLSTGFGLTSGNIVYGVHTVTATAPLAAIRATLAGLNGVVYQGDPNFNDAIGSETLSVKIDDLGNTGIGGPLSATATNAISVSMTPVNDAPAVATGSVSSVTFLEDSGLGSLGLAGVTYAPGPSTATDEAGQSLTFKVTGLPSAGIGTVYLADGTTAVVSGSSYTPAQFQGMTFRTVLDQNNLTNGGPGTFTFQVTDSGLNGGPNGDVNFLNQTLTINVTPVNDQPVLTAGTVAPLTVLEDSGTTALGLSGVTYAAAPATATDELPPAPTAQTLTFTVTAVPAATLGSIVLADGVTVVTVNTAYSLVQIRGMQFKTATDGNTFFGPATFSYKVQDNGGVLNGGVDTLVQSLTLTVTPVNDAPVRTAGALNPVTVLEDSVASSLGLGSLAYAAAPATAVDENATQALQYTVTGVPSPSFGSIVLTDGVTVVTVSTVYTLAQIQGMKFKTTTDANNLTNGGAGTFSFQVKDDGGTANSGVNFLNQSLTINVTPVNDPPVRTAGTVGPLTVLEDSGTTTLGLSGVTYAAGPATATDELPPAPTAQTLTYTVTAVPAAAFGSIVLADGVTVVTINTAYTLPQLRGMQFKTATDGNNLTNGGTGTFTYNVQDNGGVLNGGGDTLVQSLTLTVTPVNDAPVRTSALVPVTVLEDSGVSSLGLASLTFAAGPATATDELATQTLTYIATGLPALSFGSVVLSDGTTLVVVGTQYSLAQLQAMKFKTTTDANNLTNGGAGTFSFQVTDNGLNGGPNGDVNFLDQSVTINVTPVNDQPVLAAGTVAPLTVLEDSGTTTLGLSGVTYAAGPATASDELPPAPTAQTFTYTVTGVPAATLGTIVLADGTTVVTINTAYTLPQLQGMQFKTATDGNTFSGAATFSYDVKDSGGVLNGGQDTLAQSITITVTPVNDAPVRTAGTVAGLTVLEDASVTTLGLGGVNYAAGPATAVDEVGTQTLTYKVTAVPAASLGSIYLVDGITVVAAGTTYSLLQLQGMQFKTATDANSVTNGGPATFSFTVQDNGGIANSGADTLLQSLTITVTPVNDPPVRTAGTGSDLTVLEDSGLTSLGLGGLNYAPARASATDEIVLPQTLTYRVITVPGPAVGSVVLADGTTLVTAGLYSLGQIQGMQFKSISDANGGPATFSFQVQDNAGTANGGVDTLLQSLTITVTPVNDAPTLSVILNPAAILEEAGLQTINLAGISAGPVNEAGQTLTVTATSSNPGLIPNPTVSYTSPAATGTLTYTPVADQNGSAVITVTVLDNGGTTNGGTNTVVRTFTVNVTAVNDAPSLNALSNATLLEDAVTQTVNFNGISAGPSDESGQVLTVTATSSNPGLIPDPTVTYTSPNAIGSLTYTPVANQNGTATITVTVTDNGGLLNGGVNTVSQTFTVTVTAVNDQPTLTAIADPAAILEDAPLQTINLTGISVGPANEAGQTLTITTTSSNPGLIPNPTVTYTSPNAAGTLTYTPVANQNGTAVITVTISDNGGTALGGLDTLIRTFTVNVTAVNDAPTLTAIPDPAAILEDTGAQTINLSGIGVGPANEAGQTLTVTASSSNPGLILNPTVTYTSPNATASLTYTPLADQNGSAVITVTVTDSGSGVSPNVNTFVRTFTVNVTAVNDIPTLDPIGNLSLLEDPGVQSVNLTGISAGPSEGNQTVSITATSNNPGLIPNPTVSYTSPGATGLLTFTPVANQNGTAIVTVTVTDDGGTTNGGVNTTFRTFTVNVAAVNDPPTLAATPDLNLLEDPGQQTVNLTGITAGPSNEPVQTISISATSNNPGLIPNPVVTYTSPNATGTLNFTPLADQFGLATITVMLQDNGGTANGGSDLLIRTFTVNIASVNDAPAIDVIPNPAAIKEDSSQQTINLTGIGGGAANESSQTLTITAISSNPGLIPNPVVTHAAGAATGTLTYTPVPNLSGTAIITVTVKDDGGTANTGVDTTVRTFTVVVNPLLPPVLTPIGNQTVNELATLSFSVSASDPDTPQSSLVFSATGLPAGASFDPATHVFTWTPVETQGPSAANVVFKVFDGKLSASETITITVNEVNQPAVVTAAVGTASNAGTIVYNVSATDSDRVPSALQNLTLSVQNAPTGSTFSVTNGNPASGVFTWTPTDAQRPGTYVISFSAFDGVTTSTVSVTATLSSTSPGPIRMYRAYNPTADYHFFTTSQPEFSNAVAHGYRDETTGQPGFDVLPAVASGASAIFRLYNKQTGRHYYTTSVAERDYLVSLVPASNPTAGWRYEKDEGFIYAAQATGTTEIFRLYNNNSGVHLYTQSAATKNAILAQFPGVWVQHTSLGFGFAVDANGTLTSAAAQSAATAAATSLAAPVQTTITPATSVSMGTSSAENVASAVSSAAPAPSTTTAASAAASDNAATRVDDAESDANGSSLDAFWKSLSRGLAEGGDDDLLDWDGSALAAVR